MHGVASPAPLPSRLRSALRRAGVWGAPGGGAGARGPPLTPPYSTGMKMRLTKVDRRMPPKTVVPNDLRADAPAPEASTRGTTPA